MGVPKFFRWLSERYPAISQLISENRIPEFDCLYLDMNGIIHNCTHKDSDSPQFRMTEDKMFIAIFNYIEHLFGKIKPKKLFFMAIDGVAPRAKMNQQRSRRFRTALDAERARESAIREGIELPKEDPFDSNCITPGTQFMARLTEQLKYFISKKVTEDIEWQGVEVVLSGHEVPGEGEHKIMEYIRQAKAQPNYDANVRHCLYGLDADLIMLGLLSHDPHFCLLREEVTFGRQTKKSKELEQQNFYLLHLCIVREYLELEFQELKQNSALSFAYDLERVIDDFILMAFFVGNDFLPNLPNLHINEGALALMFQKYKEILPQIGGYINEHGVINVKRLAALLDQLSEFEHRFFEAEKSDEKWIQAKKGNIEDSLVVKPGKQIRSVTPSQKQLFEQVKAYIIKPGNQDSGSTEALNLGSKLPAADRKFVQQLALDLHLDFSTPEDENGNRTVQVELIKPDDSEDDGEDEESQLAITRVLKRYQKVPVAEASREQTQDELAKRYDQEFQKWKDTYYQDKFSWDTSNVTELTSLTQNYVQGLQWVLFYYYKGVASWPWYYQYHYAPMISDVKTGLGAKMEFELGQPFRPFEQLMGVLPDRSKKIVPTVYHELMTSPESPIIDFYPRDFDLDMNGKKQEWEAVVKIPFIDEKRLLAAMAPRNEQLSDDEKRRNDFGVSLKFVYSDEVAYTYPSSLPGIFPDLPNCHCVQNIFDLPTMEGLEPHAGLVEGVKLGASALAGFPTLKTLPFTGSLGFHGVSVFQQESRNESMVITLSNTEARSTSEFAKSLLNKRVHINYPFLQEAKVIKVSDDMFSYTMPENGPQHMLQVENSPAEVSAFDKKTEAIEKWYSKRLGMLTSGVHALVHVEMLKGLRKLDDGSTVKEFAAMPSVETIHASQLVVENVISQDERFIEKPALPIEEEFPDGTNAFFLGDFAYGRPVNVTGHENGKAVCLVAVSKAKQVEFGKDIARQAEKLSPYENAFTISKKLGVHPLAMSKITSAYTVRVKDAKVNLGLNLKFESKKMKVLGYSRKIANGWQFSNAAIALIVQYMTKFPDFVAAVSRNPQGDMLRVSELFGLPEDEAESRTKEIQAWLKEMEIKSLEKVPLDADQLDSDVVKQIELAADYAVSTEPAPENKTMKGIPRNALLKPADAQWRLGQQHFELGDRVIYVADSGKVPIASKGTVVGLTQTTREIWLDVVFDVSFMSGTSLGDRCSPFRGSTVPTWSVLNLTDRQVSASSKASSSRRNQTQQTSLVNDMNNLGINGQAEYREVAPPPALRGGWSGAVSGARGNGRGRGRGSTNGLGYTAQNGTHTNGHTGQSANRGNQRGGYRGGYQQIDRGDDQSGVLQRNPNFKPKSHHNVAPPSSLDQPTGSRGRGRGRGSRGRGRGTA